MLIIRKFLNSEFFDWYDHTEGKVFVPLKNDDNFHKPDWDTIIFYIRRNLLIFGRRTRLLGPITIVFLFLFILMVWWWGPYMNASSTWHPFLWIAVVLIVCGTAVTYYDWSEGYANSRAYWMLLHRVCCVIFLYIVISLFFSVWALYAAQNGNMTMVYVRKTEIFTVEVFIRCIDMVMYYDELNVFLGLFRNKLLFIEQQFETLPFSEQSWHHVRLYHRRSLIDYMLYRITQMDAVNRDKTFQKFFLLLYFQELRLLRAHSVPFHFTIREAHNASLDERHNAGIKSYFNEDFLEAVARFTSRLPHI